MWIFVIAAIIIVYVLFTYNMLIGKKNRVKQAYSGIDVYLTQRFDLIPNLVECVKGYMTHEKDTLEEITQMRQIYKQNKNIKDGEALNNECNKIIALAEDYPELKASEQFLNLQKNLSKMENQLQAARRIYNAEVNIYNNTVLMFPSNIIASLGGFKVEEFFQAEEQAQNNVKIDYEKDKEQYEKF